ncbi:MAG: MXAN_6640 family putative metalloprotease [Nocardioidaceae bacterium]
MRTRLLTGLAAGTALLLSVTTAATATATPFDTGRPGQTGQFSQFSQSSQSSRSGWSDRTRAEHTLDRAKALFTPKTQVRARQMTTVPSTHDATMVLRNLRMRIDDLSPADQRTAHQILARPTGGGNGNAGHPYTTAEATPVCNSTPSFCVHYVTSTADAATPDQVTQTVDTLQNVWSTEVDQMGYQAPLDDSTSKNHGPDGGLDVYLEDLGNDGLYGYCTSDDPSTARAASAYCVLDNDYAAKQYGTRHTPLENLQVTLAHEFFHAVQFSYDYYEDTFFMEGTAAWMEDEVYPDINDNLQYLAQSPLRYPGIPLDFYHYARSTADQSYLPYGSWIWWKFLSEWIKPGKRATDPTIIRDIWTKAKGSTYSAEALKRVLAARHKTLTDAFTTFEVWNRNPAKFYRDGKLYPVAPLGLKRTLTRAHPGTATFKASFAHLSGGTARYTPGSGLRGTWRLRIHLDMPDRVRGSSAAVTVHRRNGSQYTRLVRLNRAGDGTPSVEFGRGRVKYVELALVNDSTRYTCHRGYVYACSGKPKDGGINQGIPTRFSVKAVR